jgi:multicomponent Na+:H+ antiporter subunit D
MDSSLPFLAVLIPALSGPLAGVLSDKNSNRFTVFSTVATFMVVAAMYPAVSQGHILQKALDTGLRFNLVFMADALSLLAGIVSVGVWMLASIYSVEYMSHEHHQRRYNVFSLLSLAGMLGVLFTRNMFTLYIFFEILSVCSYVMVVHEQTEEAIKAGVKYLFMGVAGGLILLTSMVYTHSITGTSDLLELAQKSDILTAHPHAYLIIIGFVIGFGVKAGIFPVHIWLPDAHPVAPSPASALLSGVMIKAGAYGIIRTIYTIVGVEAISHHWLASALLGIAFINIFLGSAMAIKQTEIKRMLAYSSISQIGYVILGMALLSPKGILGGVVHIFNHAIIKGTLFLCAGAFIHQVGLRQLDDLKGIGKRMPLTTLCFSLGALSMIGFPPFNGFISKWFLALGALQVAKVGSYSLGIGISALAVLLLSSFMNLVYYGPIVYRAWFAEPALKDLTEADKFSQGDPNKWMMIPLLILGFGTLFFGVFPQFPVELARQVSMLYFP